MSEYINDVDVMLSAIDNTNTTHADGSTHSNHNTTTDTVQYDSTNDSDDMIHNDDEVVNTNKETINVNDEDESIDNDVMSDDDEVREDSFMLSTIDNPYNPKTAYELWKQWDTDNGHNTEEYIARLVVMHEDFNADDDDEFMLNMITSQVIDSILADDSIEIYTLIQ